MLLMVCSDRKDAVLQLSVSDVVDVFLILLVVCSDVVVAVFRLQGGCTQLCVSDVVAVF